MNIIAVDDEAQALKSLVTAIKQVADKNNISGFTSPRDALEYAKNHKIDIAFLDIDMGEMNGLFLAKQLKDIYGKTNIIFVTAHKQYAHGAMELRASGYLMKPINPSRVLEELENLRNPIEPPQARVRIQCFGSFGVFVNGEPLLFPRTKAKELLAYLVYKRGATSTMAEISTILWEDKNDTRSQQSKTRTTIADLIRVLKAASVEDIIKKGWNSIALNIDEVSCDYYEFLDGEAASINSYVGEFMSEYSWAEFIVGTLM